MVNELIKINETPLPKQMRDSGEDTIIKCSKEVKSIYIEFSEYKVKNIRVDIKGK